MEEAPDRRRDRRRMRGGRRVRDDAQLGLAFDRVLLSISDQVYHLQRRKGLTMRQLVDESGLSQRGLLDIFKTLSDPKISTLVRAAAFFDCEIAVSFRPKSATPRQLGQKETDPAMLTGRNRGSPGHPSATDEAPGGP